MILVYQDFTFNSHVTTRTHFSPIIDHFLDIEVSIPVTVFHVVNLKIIIKFTFSFLSVIIIMIVDVLYR